MPDTLTSPTAVPSDRKPILAWLNILRLLCAFEIVGFHWLRASYKLGILSCHTSSSVVYPYKNTGIGMSGFELPFLEYCKPGIDHILGSLCALLFGYGWEAVNIFIAISGFALTLSVPGAQPKHFWRSWYSRRLRRILIPFYSIALLYITVFLLVLRLHTHSAMIERFQTKLGSLFDGSILRTFLTHIFLVDPSRRHWNVSFFSPAWWFIPAILAAYICFPLYFKMCRRVGKIAFLSIAFIVTICSYWLTARGFLVDNGWYFIILNEAFSLALGIAAANVWIDNIQRETLKRRLARPSTFLSASALVVIGNVLNWFHVTYPLSSPCFTLGLCVLGMQAAMVLERWSLPRTLASVDAFALYLLHQPLAFPLAAVFALFFGKEASVAGLPFYIFMCYMLAATFGFLEFRVRRIALAQRPFKPIVKLRSESVSYRRSSPVEVAQSSKGSKG